MSGIQMIQTPYTSIVQYSDESGFWVSSIWIWTVLQTSLNIFRFSERSRWWRRWCRRRSHTGSSGRSLASAETTGPDQTPPPPWSRMRSSCRLKKLKIRAYLCEVTLDWVYWGLKFWTLLELEWLMVFCFWMAYRLEWS